jgi:predicted phosphodiesterase
MRLVLLSDIHGNISGLKAVFAYLRKLGGFDALFALGDIRGVAGTEQVLDLLIQNNAHMLRGNAEDVLSDPETYAGQTSDPPVARRRVEWCYTNLPNAYLNLLKGLPVQETVEIAPHCKVFLCHAAPGNVWSRTCEPGTPTAILRETYGSLDAGVVAYGHFHGHHVISLDGKLLINVAGVGIGDNLAAFTLLEYDDRWIVQQYQIPCDP